MKRFKFRLAAVRDQRQVVLDQKLARKAEVLAELEQALAERAQLEQLYIQTLHGGPKVGERFNAQVETWRQLQLFSLREELMLRDRELVKIRERLEQAQREVTEAHTDLKAMEILERKDREAWQHEYKIYEQKETDEVNTTRFGR
jgi:flagellar biosynthesis chaperone FliJ